MWMRLVNIKIRQICIVNFIQNKRCDACHIFLTDILNVIIAIVLFAIFFLLILKFIKTIRKKIINEILKNVSIEKIDALSGFEFEEYLYYLFNDLGFKVIRTKATRDYGADLILQINNISLGGIKQLVPSPKLVDEWVLFLIRSGSKHDSVSKTLNTWA